MTRFSVMWTHSVQIYANVLWGEDKRNSSWSNKALDNHGLSDTALWCHFCPLRGKGGGKMGENSGTDSKRKVLKCFWDTLYILECLLFIEILSAFINSRRFYDADLLDVGKYLSRNLIFFPFFFLVFFSHFLLPLFLLYSSPLHHPLPLLSLLLFFFPPPPLSSLPLS